MGFYFANPLGMLALTGIAVVALLYFLRRKSRQVTVSTLFLVQRAMPASEGGKRINRFQNTLPFWVQILAVIAMALLLAQPRWIDSRSAQTRGGDIRLLGFHECVPDGDLAGGR